MAGDRRRDRHGPQSQRRRVRARARQDAGPKRNEDVMDYCAMLRIEGRSWAEIARATGVGYSTLMEWRLLSEFEQARLRVLSAVPEAMLYKARRVYEKRLDAELRRKVPDVAIAREVVSWYDERLFRGGPGGRADDGGVPSVTGGVILLPLGTQGQASRPPTEVLAAAHRQAPARPTAPSAAVPARPGKKRQRIVMEGEE